MKSVVLILLLFFSILSFSQEKNKVYMVLENVNYIKNSYIVEFDLVIKNASDTTVLVLKPESYFFRNHNDINNEGDKYNLRGYKKPYSLNFLSSRSTGNVQVGKERIIKAKLRKSTTKKRDSLDANQLYLLEKIIKLKPNEYQKFEKIQIEKKYLPFPLKRGNCYELNVHYFLQVNILNDFLIEKYEAFLEGRLSSKAFSNLSKKSKKNKKSKEQYKKSKLEDRELTAQKILVSDFKVLINNDLSPIDNLRIIINKIKDIQSFNHMNIGSNHLHVDFH